VGKEKIMLFNRVNGKTQFRKGQEMRKVILLISAALFFISGCIETEQEIFLNADGSGKAIMDIECSPMMAMQYSMYNEESADSNAMVKEMVGQMLENDDILAWDGVDSGPTSEGGLFIKATAYFEDMSDISSGGSEIPFGGVGAFEIKRTDDGKMVLAEVYYAFEDEDANEDDKKKAELTDKQIEFKLKQLKAQLQQSKMMMGQYMGDFRYKVTIHLPGVIEDANVFTVVDENTVMFEIEGKKIMEEFDKLLGDEANLREMVKSGDGDMGMMDGDERYMRKLMLGTDEPMRVVIVPDASMNVDYTKDIETAKANFKEMVEKFGIEYVEPIEVQIDPNDVPEVVHTEVIGAALIHKSAIKDNEPGLRARQIYDYDKPRYQMHLFVDFSCPVSEIKRIEITSVVDDTGKQLVLVKEHGYSYHDYFSADKTRVKFTVRLEPPAEAARSIKSVQGVITCVSSSKIEKAQLGFIELKNEAVSTNGDVKITHIYKDDGFDPEEACSRAGQAYFEIANHGYKIHDIKLLDENGVKLKAYPPCGQGMASFGNKTQLTMEFGEVIPEVAKIEVERTRHFAEYELHFQVENISLFGKAMEE
jgi:hypothetical protein